MFELPAGVVARFLEWAGDGGGYETEDQSSELVSGRKPVGVLLGAGAGVSSHRADLNELRVARSLAVSIGGRAGKPLETSSGNARAASQRNRSTWLANRVAGRSSTLATERGQCARRCG